MQWRCSTCALQHDEYGEANNADEDRGCGPEESKPDRVPPLPPNPLEFLLPCAFRPIAGVRTGVRRSGVLATDKADEGSARERGLAVCRSSGLKTNAGVRTSLNPPTSGEVWVEGAPVSSHALSNVASSAGWGSGVGSSNPRRHSTSMWGPPCCGSTQPIRSNFGSTPPHVVRLVALRVSSRLTRTCSLLLGRPRQRSGERTSPAPISSSCALRGEVPPMQSGRWRDRRVLWTGLSAAIYSCY